MNHSETENQMSPGSWDVTGIGNAAHDITGICYSFPEPDEKIRVKSLIEGGGGSCATALVACSRLGLTTRLYSSVGDDDYGEKIISGLQKEGVNTERILRTDMASSPVAFCAVEESTGRRIIFASTGTCRGLTSKDVIADDICRSRALQLDGNHAEAAIFAAKQARNAGIPVIVDMGGMKPGMEDIAMHGDHLIASWSYARDYTGLKDPEAALLKLAREFQKRELLAITLGSEGCIAIITDNSEITASDGKESIHHLKAPTVKTVDSTGAGDVFHGAYTVALLKGLPVLERLHFAAGIASAKCTVAGARAGIPLIFNEIK